MEFFYLIACGGAEAWDYSGINAELIKIIGKGYIVEHCISLFEKKAKEKLYRIYVTDVLMGIFIRLGDKDNAITERYADWIDRKPKEEEKTGDEIAAEIIQKWNLKTKGKEDE